MRFKKKEKRVLIIYVAALILLMISFLLIFYTFLQEEKRSVIVYRTNKTINDLQQLISSLKDAETAFRGYTITRDETYLDPFYSSDMVIGTVIRQLKNELSADSVQVKNMDTLVREVSLNYRRIRYTIRNLQTEKQYSRDSLLSEIAGGKSLMDYLRRVISRMETYEEMKLSERNSRLEMASSSLKYSIVISLVFAIVLSVYSVLAYVKVNREKFFYRAKLEDGIQQLKLANEELMELRQTEQFAAIGRVSRSIAHEVRNPLTNISLAAEQLDMTIPESEENKLLLDMIRRNSARINSLVTELINSTKFVQLELSETTVNHLVAEALQLAQDRINLKGIQVEKQMQSKACKINADIEKLKIAFLNLMVNAVEAMEPNKGILGITITDEVPSKCIVKISDNGTGLSKESLSRIFEPYFSKKELGHGLGLTIAQGIILNHGGKIDVESEQGKGTTFIVTLNSV